MQHDPHAGCCARCVCCSMSVLLCDCASTLLSDARVPSLQAPDTTLDFIATFSPPGNAEQFFRTVAGLGHDYGDYGKVGFRDRGEMCAARASHNVPWRHWWSLQPEVYAVMLLLSHWCQVGLLLKCWIDAVLAACVGANPPVAGDIPRQRHADVVDPAAGLEHGRQACSSAAGQVCRLPGLRR